MPFGQVSVGMAGSCKGYYLTGRLRMSFIRFVAVLSSRMALLKKYNVDMADTAVSAMNAACILTPRSSTVISVIPNAIKAPTANPNSTI